MQRARKRKKENGSAEKGGRVVEEMWQPESESLQTVSPAGGHDGGASQHGGLGCSQVGLVCLWVEVLLIFDWWSGGVEGSVLVEGYGVTRRAEL
jgi:hypothetical protein